MAENRSPDRDRMVFLRRGSEPGGATGTAAPGPDHPDQPVGGSRRDKGGSGWLAEQRRLRAVPGSRPPASRAKHCWVVDPRWPGRHAGLLLGWEQTPEGWRGRVAVVPDDDAELVVALVASPYLERA